MFKSRYGGEFSVMGTNCGDSFEIGSTRLWRVFVASEMLGTRACL
jgi:hypothetical protein